MIWGLVPAPNHPCQIASYVTWGKSHTLSEPQFSHLLNGNVIPIHQVSKIYTKQVLEDPASGRELPFSAPATHHIFSTPKPVKIIPKKMLSVQVEIPSPEA